jgi:16S rRNA (cytosine1402-N4)-methyltransferase
VLGLLAPRAGGVVVDATAGLGGHAARLLRAVGPGGLLVGLDLDPANLVLARKALSEVGSNFRLFHANFAELAEAFAQARLTQADAILADLGVASVHLDDPARGFSFQQCGPLDMRMDPRLERTAADLVNTLPESELADLIFQLGGEHFSRKIARTIARVRIDRRIETTEDLSRLVCRALHVSPASHKSKIHPATRTFMALRIAVNDELGSLDKLLETAPGLLSPGGRLAVISFHSLEDRRVKQAFAALSGGPYQILTRKPITASEAEQAANPRSRSAKLRCVARG